MDPKTREADYEKSANEYWRWVLSAKDLLISANILEEKYNSAQESIKKQKGGELPLGFHVLAPMTSLKAKSLELFLKAIYIKLGNKVTVDGKFTYKTHDLNYLSKKVGLKFNSKQTELLLKLSKCIAYWGTYPIPLSSEDWRPDTKGFKGLQPLYSWGENDEVNYISILKKVREQCPLPKDKKIPWAFKKLP